MNNFNTYAAPTRYNPAYTNVPNIVEGRFDRYDESSYWFADDDGIDLDRFPNNPINTMGFYEDITDQITNNQGYFQDIILPLVNNNLVKFEEFSGVYTNQEYIDFSKFFSEMTRNGKRFFVMDDRLAKTDGLLTVEQLDDDSKLVSFNLISLQTLNDVPITSQLVATLSDLDFRVPVLEGGGMGGGERLEATEVERFLCRLDELEECANELREIIVTQLAEPVIDEDDLLEAIGCNIDALEDCQEEFHEIITEDLPGLSGTPTEDELLDEIGCNIDELEDCQQELHEVITEDILDFSGIPTEEDLLEEIGCNIDTLEDCQEDLHQLITQDLEDTHDDTPTEDDILQSIECNIDTLENCQEQLRETITEDLNL